MRSVYKIFLGVFSDLVIIKNKFLNNYFNPESEEAKKVFADIFKKVSCKYPKIKGGVELKIERNITYSTKEVQGGYFRVIRLGEAVLKKQKANDLRIFSSAFNLLGFKKENYIFIVAHELFHIVHYVYYKEAFVNASPESREWFADRKAIELLDEYCPGITLSEYNEKYTNSKKMIFWHKMINNYAP